MFCRGRGSGKGSGKLIGAGPRGGKNLVAGPFPSGCGIVSRRKGGCCGARGEGNTSGELKEENWCGGNPKSKDVMPE